MPKRREFIAYLARVTDNDVISESLSKFPFLESAERAIRAAKGEWHGACIYEVLVSYGKDADGLPYRVETEVSTRNYVKDSKGRFVLDEVIATEA